MYCVGVGTWMLKVRFEERKDETQRLSCLDPAGQWGARHPE